MRYVIAQTIALAACYLTVRNPLIIAIVSYDPISKNSYNKVYFAKFIKVLISSNDLKDGRHVNC